MKTLLLTTGVAIVLAACQTPQTESSEPETVSLHSEAPASFGEAIEAGGALDSRQVPSLLQDIDSTYVTLRGSAISSCAKKGCWMNVSLGQGETMRVTFKDYGFFVPKDLNGEEVVMEGMLRRKVSAVDEQRHYAEDAGKSAEEIAAIQQVDTVYSFEAVGVMIWPQLED